MIIMNNTVIFKNVKKYYKSKCVLNVKDIQVDTGEIVAIIGPNGAGKSTLIKLLSGLIRQDTGFISSFGTLNTDKNIHRIVKFVLESGGGYYQYLTAKQNIEYFLKLNNLSYNKKLKDIKYYFEKFDFGEYAEFLVSELSQGNRQKLSLITAFLYESKVLCLDEPTNGLDALSKKCLGFELEKYVGAGKIVFFTSHDLDFIRKYATRILLLNKSEIYFDGDLNDIVKCNDTEFTYKIEINLDDFNKIKKLIKNVDVAYLDNSILLTTKDERNKKIILDNCLILGYRAEAKGLDEVLEEILRDA